MSKEELLASKAVAVVILTTPLNYNGLDCFFVIRLGVKQF
jgi:hypothetical protein